MTIESNENTKLQVGFYSWSFWRNRQVLGMSFSVEKALELILNANQLDRLAHAFLITGPRGSGKERLAAKLVAELNQIPVENLRECDDPYLRIVRPQSKMRTIKVDAIREMEQLFHNTAPRGRWKIGIILEADTMQIEAENAFLKTLEEPPQQSLILLLTSQPEKLLPTVLSRCVQIQLNAPVGALQLDASERQLLVQLVKLTEQGMSGMGVALEMKAYFSNLLVEIKKEKEKQYEALMKADEKRYAKTTDARAWLKEKEKFYDAQTESDYRGARSRLMNLMVEWFGEAIRVKAGAPALSFPDHENVLKRFVENESIANLLRRVEAVESMCADIETNTQEALLLEVGCLKAFA